MSTQVTPTDRPVPDPSSESSPPDHPPTGAARWTRRTVPLAVLWSAVTVAWATTWLFDLSSHPFRAADAVHVGAVFNTSDPIVGTTVTLVLGLLGLVCAATMLGHHEVRQGVGSAALVGAWAIAATAGLVLVHGHLLAALGYTPVVLTVGWFEPALRADYLAAVTDPEIVFLVHAAIGAVLWGAAALVHGRHLRGGCVACGRTGRWTPAQDVATRASALRVGRVAVAVAVVSACFYPAMRIPWALGIPVGMRPEEWATLQATPGMTQTGIALGLAGLGGAALMVGLVRDWGVAWPRWVPGLAGRRIRVAVAVLPATVVAMALVALGRGSVLGILGGGLTTPVGLTPAHALALGSMLPWGLALGVATAAYAVRRRTRCGACGRGTAERSVRELTGVAAA